MESLKSLISTSGEPRRSLAAGGEPAERTLYRQHPPPADRVMHAPDIPRIDAAGRRGVAGLRLRFAYKGVLMLLLIVALAPVPFVRSAHATESPACAGRATVVATVAVECDRRGR